MNDSSKALKKRVLLVTSKNPYCGTESDGGTTTVGSVISSLKDSYDLDVLFVRKYSEDESRIPGVKHIFFEEIEHKSSSKFERRILNCEQISRKIIEIGDDYEHIIIVHISKAFGLEEAPERTKRKVVLYPMFLSFDYSKSGEFVPPIYQELEKGCLSSIRRLICPSEYDKKSIVDFFGYNEKNIEVIPRSVSGHIEHRKKEWDDGCIKLLSIGNIKERKQPLALIKMFKRFHDRFSFAELYLAGEVQDEYLYRECLRYLADENLADCVHFLGAVTQERISQLIGNCTINVTASNLETFGRCVFEGMYGGLPTVAFDKLACLNEFIRNGEGIFLVKDEKEFIGKLMLLSTNKVVYEKQSELALKSTDFISFEKEKKHLNRFLHSIEEKSNEI